MVAAVVGVIFRALESEEPYYHTTRRKNIVKEFTNHDNI